LNEIGTACSSMHSGTIRNAAESVSGMRSARAIET
jgi:hypothetical protein